MNKNYNDIIDIILTFLEDDEIAKCMAVFSSVVPYIILSKESKREHKDLKILVREKFISDVRKKVKELSKEFDFDIIDDSKKCISEDYGFKIDYQGTIARFYPYSIINNNFKIKSYTIDNEEKIINLKTKTVPDVSKNEIIKSIRYEGKILRIISPEYILADIEAKDLADEETAILLRKLCDESVLKSLRKNIYKAKIERDSKKISLLSKFGI